MYAYIRLDIYGYRVICKYVFMYIDTYVYMNIYIYMMIDRQIHDWVEHSSQFRSGEPQPLTGFLKICVPEAVINIFVRLGSETKLNPRLLRAWCSLFCLARGKRSIGAIGRGSRKRCATKGFQRVSITYLSTASGFGYCYSLQKRP